MRDPENIREVLELKPDYLGLIFYEKSPRFVREPIESANWPESVKKVGVFVDPELTEVLQKVKSYGLDLVQLHGDESIQLVQDLVNRGVQVMKVFRLSNTLPLGEMEPYAGLVSHFLFDTQSLTYGGSGQKFDWTILKKYPFDVPFFLSGGIELSDIEEIKKLDIDQLQVIDVNSKFETAPAVKDVKKIEQLKAIL